MPVLTRRRSPDPHREVWHVFYGDVRVGSIGERAGVPVDVDQWGWTCGFYPGVHPRDHQSGSAATFEQARAAFEAALNRLLPKVTPTDFDEYRRDRAFHAWKYAMKDAGCTMPTATADGRSRCFCGADIDIKGMRDHIYTAHMDLR